MAFGGTGVPILLGLGRFPPQEAPMAGPLVGYTVLDLTWGITGPLATMIMADYGADVIRVSKPGETEMAHPGYRVWNRGKKSLTLDVKKAESKAVLEKLLPKIDVLVESF